VLEGENGDGVELSHEIESAAKGARRSRCVPVRSIPRFVFMAAPKFFAAPYANREIKISSGPVVKDK
jgi:hypothetical protein